MVQESNIAKAMLAYKRHTPFGSNHHSPIPTLVWDTTRANGAETDAEEYTSFD
jgi:hypothetical protein